MKFKRPFFQSAGYRLIDDGGLSHVGSDPQFLFVWFNCTGIKKQEIGWEQLWSDQDHVSHVWQLNTQTKRGRSTWGFCSDTDCRDIQVHPEPHRPASVMSDDISVWTLIALPRKTIINNCSDVILIGMGGVFPHVYKASGPLTAYQMEMVDEWCFFSYLSANKSSFWRLTWLHRPGSDFIKHYRCCDMW